MARWRCRRVFLGSVNKAHNNALSLGTIRPEQCLEAVRTIRIGASETSTFIISKRCLTSNVQPSRRFSSEGESSRKRSLKLMDFPVILYGFPLNKVATVVSNIFNNWMFTQSIRRNLDQEFSRTKFIEHAEEVDLALLGIVDDVFLQNSSR